MIKPTLDLAYMAWSSDPTIDRYDDLFRLIRAEARRVTRDDDIAQDVCILAMEKINTFAYRQADSVAYWIRSLTYHVAKGTRRDTIRHAMESLPEYETASADHECLDTSQLDPFRRSVANGLLAGNSLGEIAAALNMNASTLRNSLRRLRQKKSVMALTNRRVSDNKSHA